jgi:hypothetical protein
MNGRERAIDLMDEMLSLGQSPETLLKYVVCNYLSGSEAFNAMQCAMEEYFGEEEEEDLVDGSSWRESEDFFDEEEDYNSALLYGVDNNQ